MRHRHPHHLAILVSFLVSLLLAACGRGGADQEAADDRASALAIATDQAKGVTAQLTAIREGFPDPSTLQERPCPDGDIESWSPDSRQRLVRRIHWNHLLRVTGGPDTQKTDSLFASSLTGMRMSGLPVPGKKPSNQSQFVRAIQAYTKTHYLAVIRPTVVVPPAARGVTNFTPGRFEAWVVVYRLADATPICQAKLTARSSGNVTYSTKSGDHSGDRTARRDYSLREDLKRQVTQIALRETLGRISKVLR